MVVIYEAAGMDGETQSLLVRSLLSEGRIRYPTVVKRDGELVGVMIEKEGPTGLITTTTQLAIHPENETRLITLYADDSKDQTKRVLLAACQEHEQPDGVDFGRWHALQRWLELGERRVTIPFAQQIAELIPPVAVRLRRDWKSVLAAIRAHALLHQATRPRDDQGRIIATIEDYAAVRDLLGDAIAHGVEATIKPEIRELVNAVPAPPAEVTQKQLAEKLGIDKGAVSRRVRAALNASYLINNEQRRGKPHKLTTGEPLPDDVQLLPHPDQLAHTTGTAAPSAPPAPFCPRQRDANRDPDRAPADASSSNPKDAPITDRLAYPLVEWTFRAEHGRIISTEQTIHADGHRQRGPDIVYDPTTQTAAQLAPPCSQPLGADWTPPTETEEQRITQQLQIPMVSSPRSSTSHPEQIR